MRVDLFVVYAYFGTPFPNEFAHAKGRIKHLPNGGAA